MNEQLINHNQQQESELELVYRKKINEIEQKVSKYCSQYDALMNLLPLGNSFQSVFLFQRDLQNFTAKIESLDQKIGLINDGNVQIEKKNYQTLIQEIKSKAQANKTQIQNIEQDFFEQSYHQDPTFQQSCIDKLTAYEQAIMNKLANYKNQLQFQNHKEMKNNHIDIKNIIIQKVKQSLNPINSQLDQLLEQIQICKLKVPLRDIKKFHDFNHQRLLDQIVNLNDKLEELFQACNHQEIPQKNMKISLARSITRKLESIHFQAKANKLKCLNDLLIDPNQQNISSAQKQNTQKYIIECYFQIEQNLKQVRNRHNLLKQFIDSV